MHPVKPGQRVNVDVFGLGLPGAALCRAGVLPGTIIGVAPGALIVRLDGVAGSTAEVTVGRSRVQQLR